MMNVFDLARLQTADAINSLLRQKNVILNIYRESTATGVLTMKAQRDNTLLGLRIGVGTLESLLDRAMYSIEAHKPPFTFACANPHSLVAAHRDDRFMNALKSCSAVVADGVGITLIAKLTAVDVGPRITGLDFFMGLMSGLNRRGGRVFFFGSTTLVLQRVIARVRHDFPNLNIEVFSPPYGEWSSEQNAQMIAHIREARPDVLWVGMTAPKQEKWVHDNLQALNIPVIGSVGAVFDYYAGTVKRAPEWLCRAGLEWAYRLLGEPRRLWRRTIISAPLFLFLAARQRLLTAFRESMQLRSGG